MSKIRIYIKSQDIKDSLIVKDREVLNKLKNVLRLNAEDDIRVFDGKGKEYAYTIENISKKSISLKNKSIVKAEPEPKKHISLAFPLAKEEKIDFILQKATELGAGAFIPFVCERSLHFSVTSRKIERWQKIIIEATRQSERLWLPVLRQACSFSEMLAGSYDIKFALSISGKTLNRYISEKNNRILLAVGPEGDFSSRESKLLEDKVFQFLSISYNTLRLETAAIFATGLINHHLR
ncbi:MAG: 16S rRNA (uracil(1498)-N(3))-methyltransferase [Candidatus Omnitrophica bacterium]|nr:16S rRNA (uracil(1498)-N(3))-methyltransferase [Candidatus Omnitrophota bacterium]